jgi:hypothetical protein
MRLNIPKRPTSQAASPGGEIETLLGEIEGTASRLTLLLDQAQALLAREQTGPSQDCPAETGVPRQLRPLAAALWRSRGLTLAQDLHDLEAEEEHLNRTVRTLQQERDGTMAAFHANTESREELASCPGYIDCQGPELARMARLDGERERLEGMLQEQEPRLQGARRRLNIVAGQLAPARRALRRAQVLALAHQNNRLIRTGVLLRQCQEHIEGLMLPVSGWVSCQSYEHGFRIKAVKPHPQRTLIEIDALMRNSPKE